ETSVPGFYSACGFSGHGFMHAPAAGKVVGELIDTGRSDPDVSELSPGRFAEGRLVHESAGFFRLGGVARRAGGCPAAGGARLRGDGPLPKRAALEQRNSYQERGPDVDHSYDDADLLDGVDEVPSLECGNRSRRVGHEARKAKQQGQAGAGAAPDRSQAKQ